MPVCRINSLRTGGVTRRNHLKLNGSAEIVSRTELADRDRLAVDALGPRADDDAGLLADFEITGPIESRVGRWRGSSSENPSD